MNLRVSANHKEKGMGNNFWLHNELKKKAHLRVDSNYEPLIEVQYGRRHFSIYTPNHEEYIITIDVVEMVKSMGGDTISFPSSWCRASGEAILYGKENGVRIIPHGKLFELLGG
jgi:hypothetical protein